MCSLPLLAPRALSSLGGPAPTGASTSLDASIQADGHIVVVPRPARIEDLPAGQTLAQVAAANRISLNALLWANGLSEGSAPTAGTALLIPPTDGVLIPAGGGERPTQVAARLHLDPAVLLDYNNLMENSPEPSGAYLQVPAAAVRGPALPANDVVPAQGDVPVVPSSQDNTSGANIFPYGQCTWYVASKRAVSWDGNADQWLANARGIRPEGSVPVANAIVVFDNAPVGHVGLVQSVNPDGSFVITEMNYYGNGGGWGTVDTRTISANDPLIMGFIY